MNALSVRSITELKAESIAEPIIKSKGEFKKSPLSSLLSSHHFTVYQQNTLGREAAELAVKSIFSATYKADISDFLPLLITANKEQNLDAVIGLRSAHQCELFLESYLTMPIEKEAKERYRIDIDRKKLVEIGNLVSSKSGVSRQLFIVLAFALHKAGIEWVSFTATPQVEQLLHKLAFQPLEICQAQEQLAVNSSSLWGSYYAQSPKVSIGNVAQAVTTLKQTAIINAMYPKLVPLIDDMATKLQKGLSL
jgi:hypothetical protein